LPHNNIGDALRQKKGLDISPSPFPIFLQLFGVSRRDKSGDAIQKVVKKARIAGERIKPTLHDLRKGIVEIPKVAVFELRMVGIVPLGNCVRNLNLADNARKEGLCDEVVGLYIRNFVLLVEGNTSAVLTPAKEKNVHSLFDQAL